VLLALPFHVVSVIIRTLHYFTVMEIVDLVTLHDGGGADT
jgi:hypothetical protein